MAPTESASDDQPDFVLGQCLYICFDDPDFFIARAGSLKSRPLAGNRLGFYSLVPITQGEGHKHRSGPRSAAGVPNGLASKVRTPCGFKRMPPELPEGGKGTFA